MNVFPKWMSSHWFLLNGLIPQYLMYVNYICLQTLPAFKMTCFFESSEKQKTSLRQSRPEKETRRTTMLTGTCENNLIWCVSVQIVNESIVLPAVWKNWMLTQRWRHWSTADEQHYVCLKIIKDMMLPRQVDQDEKYSRNSWYWNLYLYTSHTTRAADELN